MVHMIPCRLCERPWHPATGAVYGKAFLVCVTCEREFWTWLRNRTNSPPARRQTNTPTARSFYEHAGDHIAIVEEEHECSATERDS